MHPQSISLLQNKVRNILYGHEEAAMLICPIDNSSYTLGFQDSLSYSFINILYFGYFQICLMICYLEFSILEHHFIISFMFPTSSYSFL